MSILAPSVAGGKSRCLISPEECCIPGRERSEAGDGALQEAEGFVSRGSKDCLCCGSLLEMSDPSKSAFSQSPQGKGCFCSQLGGTEPFHLQGSFKFLRKSCAGLLGLPKC